MQNESLLDQMLRSRGLDPSEYDATSAELKGGTLVINVVERPRCGPIVSVCAIREDETPVAIEATGDDGIPDTLFM